MKLDIVKMLRDIGLPSNDVQDRLLKSEARFKIFRAARRVGKSFTAAESVMEKVLTPNTRGWIVGPTYDLAEKEFRYILDFLLKMNKKFKLPRPITIRDNPKSGELYIETPWGSEVHGKSADRPLSLVGEENDWIILSEAAQHKKDTWTRYLRPTLSTRMGSCIIPTTPDVQGFWLYELEEKVKEWRADGDLTWETFTCPAWECGHYNPEEIEAARNELPEDAFREQFGGEWRFHTGRVFKPYSPEIHLIDSFEIPKSWKTRVGIDYGLRDATCAIFEAESPRQDFYFCDEYYASDKPSEVHIDRVKRLEKPYSIVARVADHHALGSQLRMDWARMGLSTLKCPVNIKTKRDKLMAFLELKPDRIPIHEEARGNKIPGEYPRIFIFRDKCPNLAREVLFLRWKDSERKEGNYGDVVGDDHAVDAAEMVHWYATKNMGEFNQRNRTKKRRNPVNSMTGY